MLVGILTAHSPSSRHSRDLARHRRHAYPHRNTHMTVRRASLDNFDRASVVDPIAHFVPIKCSIGNSRREIVEPGMQEWQIHNEVNKKPFPRVGKSAV